MLSVLALVWAYVRFGTAPQADWILYGIKPVIIGVVVQAFLSRRLNIFGHWQNRGMMRELYTVMDHR